MGLVFLNIKAIVHRLRVPLIGLLVFFSSGGVHAGPMEIVKIGMNNFPIIDLYIHRKSPFPDFIKDSRNRDEREIMGPVFSVTEEFRGSARKPELLSRQPVPSSAEILDLVIVLDSTLSVDAKNFQRSVAGTLSLLEKLDSRDRVALYSFQGEPVLLSGFASPGSESLRKSLVDLVRNGTSTRVYDALYSGLYTARQSGSGDSEKFVRRRAVLLFTDGVDEGSFLTEGDVHELAALGDAWDIPVFTVFSGRGEGNTFRRLAMKTGGKLFQETGKLDTELLVSKLRQLPGELQTLTIQSSVRPSSFPMPGESLMIHVFAGDDMDLPPASISVPIPFWLVYGYGIRSFFSGQLSYVGVGLLLIGFLLLLSILMKRKRNNYHDQIGLHRTSMEASSVDSAEPESMDDDILVESVRAQAMVEEEIAHLPDAMAENQDPVSLPEGDDRLSSGSASGNLYTDIAVRPGSTPTGTYMRDYAYRMLQNALRKTPAYTFARIEPAGDLPPEHFLEYDLFLEHTVIGSGSLSNIRLKDSTVSPVHARIRRVDGRFVLYDLLSAAGTRINGKKLLRPRGLQNGDLIRFGSVEYRFIGENDPPSPRLD